MQGFYYLNINHCTSIMMIWVFTQEYHGDMADDLDQVKLKFHKEHSKGRAPGPETCCSVEFPVQGKVEGEKAENDIGCVTSLISVCSV